jgi:hypothetical protein
MNGLALCLPLANNRNFLTDNIVRRHRIGGHQEDEDIAGAKLLLDLRVPIGAARHVLIDPKIEHAMLHRRLQIGAHEAEPLDFLAAWMLRLILVAVTDKYKSFSRTVRHGGDPLQLTRECRGNPPSQ